ncbi:hypothetical protein DH2020_036156 [Rehmannia glutinosa]|uniref:rRNA biogenesis protein RRP36 n=1 Tax=Rehmannia glutinosa TaxID=99300 RepID=A0ABR0V7L9_REHGL
MGQKFWGRDWKKDVRHAIMITRRMRLKRFNRISHVANGGFGTCSTNGTISTDNMKKSEPAIATSSKIRFEDSDEHVSSSEDEGEIERELAEVTFEELQKARSDGSEMVYRKPNADKKGSRANKNRFSIVSHFSYRVFGFCGFLFLTYSFRDFFRPMEMSSKKPVSRFREVIQVPKKDLKKQMRKANDPEAINELKDRISRIDKELKSAVTKRTEKDILAEHKKKEREAAKKGKQPYYLKKSELRKQKLVEKYKELKESGKLEAFIEKKRRKNAAKDHRYIPYRRPTDNGSQ